MSEPVRRAVDARELRGVAPIARGVGLFGCMAGALLRAYASRTPAGVHSPLGYSALAVVAVSWAIFAYVIVRRTRYARARALNPES